MFGILITLSAKRLAVLQEEPETLMDVVEAREEEEIPGLLDIGNAWDALDFILSERGKDDLLGDAVLGRSGKKFGDGSARVLGPARVTEIAKRLESLAPSHVASRYGALANAKAHGKVGATPDDEEREALELLLRRMIALYKDAAKQQHSMLLMLL
ncbi:MAG TPA: DUF1877 family protein [Kofleriaceae bacterium]|jgi:hypothetical protein